MTRLATRGRANLVSGAGRMLRRWERALIVLAVCLPVPVFAATGLSIPLPSTVERLAVALVPWAEAASFEADESLTLGADGTIVLASHEVAGVEAEAGAGAGAAPLADGGATRLRAAAEERTQRGGKGGTEGKGTPADGDSDGTSSGPVGSEPVGSGSGGGSSGGGGSGGGGGSSGGGSSGGSSGPVGSVIEQTEPATAPVVEVVDETVDDPVGTVGGVVGGILPGAGP